MTQTSGLELAQTSDLTKRWPIELLLSVFDISNPIQVWDPRSSLRSLLALSWVCTRWRQATIDYKQFWNTIVLDWPSELLELYLQRSVDFPLHVFFNSDRGDPHFIDEERHNIQRNFRQVFGDAANMNRIRRMDLTVLDTSLNVVLDEYISQHEAPTLETFVYHTENYGLRRQPAFAHAFGGVPPPRLRYLVLSGDMIPAQSPVLSTTLTELILDEVGFGNASGIFTVLRSLTSLERLTLRKSLDQLRGADLSLGKTVKLPDLRSLEVGDETFAVANFVRCLHLPHLQNFQLSIMHDSDFVETNVSLIRSSMETIFNAVEQTLISDTSSQSPSYDELCVRFGVIYSHLEFILSGGRDGFPQRLQFSFHDTDYLGDDVRVDEGDPKPSIALVRHGLQKLPFLSRVQSLVIGPTADFTNAEDLGQALDAMPHMQTVSSVGADGTFAALGLVQALRARPALLTRLKRVRLFNFTSSASNVDQELSDRLGQIDFGVDIEVGREQPLELSIEGHQGLQPETFEHLRRMIDATSVCISEG